MATNERDAMALTSGLRAPGNEYDQVLKQGGQQKRQLNGAAFVAAKRDPERWAKVLKISEDTRLPSDLVDRNFDQLQEADTRQRASAQYDRATTGTPGLTEWLKNPDNATLGRDEIPHLATIDRASRAIKFGWTPSTGFFEQNPESGFDYAPTIGLHDLAAASGTFAAVYGMGDPVRIAGFVAGSNKRARELKAQAPDYVTEFQGAMQAHGGDVNKAAQAWLASQEDNGRSEIRKQLDSFKTGAITLGEALSMFGAALRRPRGFAYQVAEGFLPSLPMLAGAVAGGAAGGPMGLVGGTFIGGVAPSVGAEMNAELEKHGVDVTDPESLAKAYSDPTLMAALREKGARKGVTSTAVIALMSPFAGKFLQAAGEGAGVGTKVVATAADVGVQAGGVGAGQVLSQKVAGEKVDVGAAVQTTIATLGYALGAEALGASRRGLLHKNPIRAATEATTQAEEALRALQNVQALSEIGTAVSGAKTTQQVPERLRSLVEMATGGDENAQVYFQTKDWDEHFQSMGTSPAKAVADIMGDDGKAYYEAKATGSPLAIPLADYVARVAPTEHWNDLLSVARTKPDGMSLLEATDYLKSLPATMQEIAAEAAATPEPVKPAPIRERIIEQALSAGRSQAEAEAVGTIYESAFRTLGKRSGIDPGLLFERYQLRVRKAEGDVAPPVSVPSGPPASGERRSLSAENDAARAAYDAAAQAVRDFPAERRQMLLDAFRQKPDMLDLKQEARLSGKAKLALLRKAEGDLPAQMTPRHESGLSEPEWRNTPVKPWVLRDPYSSVIKKFDTLDEALAWREKQPVGKYIPNDIAGSTPEEFAQGERGRIRIDPVTRQAMIDLFKPADRSTLVHETGHFYLEVLGDLAKAENAAPELVADHAAIRQWLGAEGDTPLSTAQHEQFARGFEAYLMEGKAPSQELRTAFYRFKRWLLNIYKEVSTLNVELTPEVRRVFDRMLAVDEEIAKAEEGPGGRPLFDDPASLGMNETEAASYQLAVNEAHQAAEEALTARMMKQIKKEESAEWKAWRDPIEKEVTDETNKRPEYRALSFLKDGTAADGTPLPEGTATVKLSRQAVKETYGDEAAKALPKGVTGKDGAHPDLVAEAFGYRSGKELVEALGKAPKKEALIKSTTDARMQLEHGERLSELQVKDAATEAVQNEKRSQVLRKELEFLASDHLAALKGLVRKVTRMVPPTEATRAEARKIVGSKTVRDLRPIVYERAAQKLANEAREALLRGDVEAAFNAKRKELLTNEVFRVARDAKDSIEAAFDEFKKVFRADADLAKTRDMDLVNAARAILASFGIGKSDKPAAAYLEQMKRYDPEIYETVQAMVNEATAQAGPYSDYRSLSYDDFTALRETVGSLWKLSRRNRQIEIDGQKLDRVQVQEELSARIGEIGLPEKRVGYDKAVTNWEKTQRSLMTGRSWLRRVEHWADAMDQGNPDGPFRKYIWNPISEGVATYRIGKRSVIEKYLEIVKPVEKSMRSGTIESPEIGYTFEGKAELLGALLHRGNESNFSKLLRGREWGKVDENGVLDTSRWDAFERRLQEEGVLTKADYDYAQGVWDLFDDLKQGAQKAHNEMYGHYFAEVTAKEFDTPFGKYKGGYVPAKADPFLVPDQAIKREAESLTSGADNSFMFPTTGRGFTKSRVEAYARPLIMNAAFVPSQLDAVLRFTHIEPRVKDVGRVVVSRTFRTELDSFDPTVGGEMLVPWLQRSAQQRVDLPGKFPMMDRFFKGLRTRTGLQIMTANVVNSLQQFTGVAISMTKVEPARMASALWAYTRDPKGTSAAVAEKSPFMRTRMTATVMEIQKVIDNIMLDPSKYDKLRAFTTEHGYFLASGTQSIVDHITWMGKYDQAIREGATDRDAVRQADSAVRETQGSFAPEDVSRAEAQTPFVRAFLQFYGYFNMQANLLGTEFLNIQRNLGLKKGAGKLLFAYTVGFAIPAVLSDALTRGMSNRPFDQDDDGPIDDVFDLFFGSQMRTASRFVPVVGQLSDAVIGRFTKAQYDDSIRLSPAVTALERALSVPADAYHAIRDKQLTNKGILDFLTAVGLMTGLPTAPLAKPVNYLRDFTGGKAHPKNAYDFARGLVTGR